MLQFPFPTSPIEFLLWASIPGSAGVIFALLFERAAWFQALSRAGKQRFVLAFFLGIPVLATLALSVLGQLVLPSAPADLVVMFLGIALSSLQAWAVSQYAHDSDPATQMARLSRLVK